MVDKWGSILIVLEVVVDKVFKVLDVAVELLSLEPFGLRFLVCKNKKEICLILSTKITIGNLFYYFITMTILYIYIYYFYYKTIIKFRKLFN